MLLIKLTCNIRLLKISLWQYNFCASSFIWFDDWNIKKMLTSVLGALAKETTIVIS